MEAKEAINQNGCHQNMMMVRVRFPPEVFITELSASDITCLLLLPKQY